MRNIDYLIAHHTVTPRDWSREKTLEVVNKEHQNFTDQGQVLSGTQWANISYNYIIGDDWVEMTRLPENIGYHAGNDELLSNSLAVCFVGDYRTDKLIKFQIQKFKEICEEWVTKYPHINITGHRTVRKGGTICPGGNISEKWLDGFESKEKYKTWAIGAGIMKDGNWLYTDYVRAEELNKLTKHILSEYGII